MLKTTPLASFFIVISACGFLSATAAHGQMVTSAKRFVLLACVSVTCASLFLLPQGRKEIARLLAIAAAILLILSYGGVMLVPHLQRCNASAL